LGARFFSRRLATRLVAYLRLWQATDDPEVLRRTIELADRTVRPEVRRPHRWRASAVRVRVRGWAADPAAGTVADRVAVSWNGRALGSAVPDRARPDVARALGNGRLERSGFEVRGRVPDIASELCATAWFATRSLVLRHTQDIADGYGAPATAPQDEVVGYIDDVYLAPQFGHRWAMLGRRPIVSCMLSKDAFATLDLLVLLDERAEAVRIVRALRPLLHDRRADLARTAFDAGDERLALALLAEIPRRPVHGLVTMLVAPEEVAVQTEGDAGAATMEVATAPNNEALGPLVATVPVPIERLHRMRDATVRFGSVVLDAQQRLVLHEKAANPAFDFVAGNWEYVHGSAHRYREALLTGPSGDVVELRTAALLDGRVAVNYFHALFEYLPRLVTIDEFVSREVPALVSSRWPVAAREALDLALSDRRCVTVDVTDVVRVGDLWIPSPHTFHPDTTQLPWITGSAFSTRHARWLRELGHRAAQSLPSDGPARVFLVRRGTARGLLNSDEVEQRVVDLGFTAVDPAGMSFAEQVRLYRDAEVIIGAGGAAFTNLVFCKPGAQVVGLVARSLWDYPIFANIARFAGAEVFNVLGIPVKAPDEVPFRRDYFHLDFTADPEAVARAAEAALAAHEAAISHPRADAASANTSSGAMP
jgi:capsular polysaccharide biosynthesis protein